MEVALVQERAREMLHRPLHCRSKHFREALLCNLRATSLLAQSERLQMALAE